MKEIKLKFYSAKKRPNHSCMVIAVYENGSVSTIGYSKVHNQFNNYDNLEYDNENYESIFPIKLWAYADDIKERLLDHE